jgi:hypothetical protein
MLSRMNLTLSALALSNGLNLGTRACAANADVNLDGQTLYIQHSHHGVMREGMVPTSFSKPKSKVGIKSIPSSISPVQVQQPSCTSWQRGGWAVEGCDVSEPRPADLTGMFEPRRDVRVTPFPALELFAGNPARRGLERQAPAAGKVARIRRTARRRARTTCSATASAATVGK